MGKRKNKGKGKVITAAFGAVQHNGTSYQAVMVATSKKGAIATQLWACLPGQKGAPACVLVSTLPGVPAPQTTGMALAAAQVSYNGHPRRCASGPNSPAAQFGLQPAPVKAAPAAPSAPASGANA